MKTEILHLNTSMIDGIFTGTYENIWEVEDHDDDGHEPYIDYDFKEFMQSIVHAYQNEEEYIKDELNIDFIINLKFPGGHYSPREYNFSTDSLDIDITIDLEKFNSTLESLKNDQEFDKFLHDNYTSYDGFWSWTPNNYPELYEQIKTQGNRYDQAMSAVINYLIYKEFKNTNLTNSIEYYVYDNWQGNGYGGLDYKTLCEACNKEIMYCQDCGKFEHVEPSDCEEYKKCEPINKNQLSLI